MKEQQTRKNCQVFINKLQNSSVYDNIKQLLLAWKRHNNKIDVPVAIDTFMKISKIVHGCGQQQKDEKLIEFFNRCLVKEAIVPKKTITSGFVQQMASQNPSQANQIISNIQDWVKKENKPVEKIQTKPIVVVEQIKDNLLMSRLEGHPNFRQIIKIVQLYLKSIITFDEIRSLLHPLYSSDTSLISCLVQNAQDIIQKRRKATIFASLNELVDKKYPNLEQVGNSYILIPQGYANYSKTWKTNPLQYIMNRKCVSVPLGSEVSFIINKKTDYQEQLFMYEDQRYEIDNTLCSLKAVISILNSSSEHPHRLQSPLLQRIINQLYPTENITNFFIRNPDLAKNVLLPRVIQKRDELILCRDKFIKICQEVANKNFYKSLDYRCFYFAKNDKKFNCPSRWQKQIQMRKDQIIKAQTMINNESVELQQIQDRQSLQRGRFYYVNSFDNITKQDFIENRQIEPRFDCKFNARYPSYPDNQILFILNFADLQILNDVLQIILYYCNRKNLLELLIFKLMRTNIDKNLKKSPLLNYLIENKQKIANNAEINEILSNLKNSTYMSNLEQQGFPSAQQTLLNEPKNSPKNFKDSDQQFMQMIEQDEEPLQIEQSQSPFEGPQNCYTFIGTKQIYMFLRYVTAIYQRFYKAKQYSQQMSSPEDGEEIKSKVDIYKFFLTVMIFKIKDRKYFQEYLRKIFCKNAFIFFTLEKMIISAAKIINNISIQSLNYQIIKDQTKDYELGAFDWEKYVFPNVTMQLTRLYMQNYDPRQKNFYVSSWNPPFKQISQSESYEQLAANRQQYITKPVKLNKQKWVKSKRSHEREKPHHEKQRGQAEQVYNGEQITRGSSIKLMLKGEILIVNKDRDRCLNANKNLKAELDKIKRMRKNFKNQ